MEAARFRERVSFRKAHAASLKQMEAAMQSAVCRIREKRERTVRDSDVRRPAWKSNFTERSESSRRWRGGRYDACSMAWRTG